jgi:hypothetical protein
MPQSVGRTPVVQDLEICRDIRLHEDDLILRELDAVFNSLRSDKKFTYTFGENYSKIGLANR